MAQVTFKGDPIKIFGELPAVGSTAPAFTLVGTDLSEVGLADFTGKRVVMSMFPSLDTSVCAESVKRFNKAAQSFSDVVILGISADLPFAHQRFYDAEGITHMTGLSTFRSPLFGEEYGLVITEGPLRGLLSRAVVVVDGSGKVAYTQQVPEITVQPDYDAVTAFLKA